MRAPQVSHSRRDVAVYALRLGLAVALMEALTHYMHMWAINKAKIWRQFSPYEICLLGYWTLNIMWLKVRFRFAYPPPPPPLSLPLPSRLEVACRFELRGSKCRGQTVMLGLLLFILS